MSEGIKRMLAERARLAAGPVLDQRIETAADRADQARLFKFLDQGWDGSGWKPSSKFVIGRSALLTSPSIAPKQREGAAEQFCFVITREARRRYREGFYADPWSTTPRFRDDATPWAWPAGYNPERTAHG
jgi:hypothetical protein